jgi:LysR family transcriptional regulator, hydrogen peroxide-inducible genes activator
MDIHHIRYFLALCETLNFTQAAERCHVAQPALSRAIQQLEEEVGGALIHRERNGNSLTELGLLMKPRFQNVIGEIGQAKQQASRFLTLEKANLNIGILCTVGPTRFAALLVHFSRIFPGITVQVFEGAPDQLNNRLKANEIDLALSASPNGFPEELAVETLYQERFVVAFSHGHRFASMNAVPVAAVDGENYLRRLNCEYYDQLSDLVDNSAARVQECFTSEREDWIQNMVAGGLGICFLPEFSALIPGIQTRPLLDPEVWRDICLVTRKGQRRTAAAEQFLTTLREYPYPTGQFPAMPNT